MSTYNSLESFLLQGANNMAKRAKEIKIEYATLGDVPDEYKRKDVLIFITSDTTYYRWNPIGLVWDVAIHSASGTIMSASNVGTGTGLVYKEEVSNDLRLRSISGTASQITVTNNTNDITLSLPQNINTTANVIFNNANLATGTITTAPSGLTDITNKIYVDNANNLDLKKASNLLDLSNTTIARNNLGLSNVQNILHNFTAITDPTINDDSGDGYVVGSRWINTVLNRAWFATGVAPGGAIWVRGVSLIGELDDVDTTGAQTTDSLCYNGAQWIPCVTTAIINVQPSRIINLNLDALFSGNTQVNDSSNNALVGVLSNLDATNLVAGKFGNCIYFDDANNLITFANSSILDFEHDAAWTVSFWMKTASSNSTTRTLLGCADGPNGSGNKITYQSNLDRFEFSLHDNISARQLVCRWNIGTPVNNNLWNHFAFVHRGGQLGYDDSSMDMYFNGVNQASVKIAQTVTLLPTDSIISGLNFTIGGQAAGGNNINDHFLDEISIFDFAMVNDSVESLYNGGTGVTIYDSISTTIQHHQDQNTVVGLVNRLNNIESTSALKLANITSSNTNLLTIGGTATEPTILPLVQSHNAITLQLDTIANFTKIATNNNADFSLATQMSFGKTPFNLIDTDTFELFLRSLYDHSLPLRLMLSIQGSPASYAEFVVHSPNGETSNSMQFLISYDALNSTVSTFPANSFLRITFANKQKSHIAGSNKITVLSSSNNEIITSDIVESNIEYKNIIGAGKNNLRLCDLHAISFGVNIIPHSTSFSAYDSMTVVLSNTNANLWDTMMYINPPKPQRPISMNNGTLKDRMYGVRLVGSAWVGKPFNYLCLGWGTSQYFENIENNIVNGNSVWQTTWNVSATSANRAFTMHFFNNQIIFNRNGASPPANFIGGAHGSMGVGDILISSFDYANGSVILYLFRGGVQICLGYEALAGFRLDNFWNSNVHPIISQYSRGPDYGLEILSGRELTDLALRPNNESYFV